MLLEGKLPNIYNLIDPMRSRGGSASASGKMSSGPRSKGARIEVPLIVNLSMRSKKRTFPKVTLNRITERIKKPEFR